MRITRLAPSPTGALHLGNARTFVVNWLLARQNNWRIILRVEDLDGPRIKRGADQKAMEDLRWLGLDWDAGPIYQSSRMDQYQRALHKLLDAKLAYPCVCSRREAELAASAPHAEDGSAVYPGTCRGKFASIEEAKEATGRAPVVRFCVPRHLVEFVDGFCGPQSVDMSRLGDFVIAKNDGTPAYQLAVVVDDAEMGVTDVVRGNDLLESTARQIVLYEALGLAHQIPHYVHLPLVVGTDGRRLAKRHGDTRLEYYRSVGVSADRVRMLVQRWCGGDGPFNLMRLPKEPVVFTAEDDAWLRNA